MAKWKRERQENSRIIKYKQIIFKKERNENIPGRRGSVPKGQGEFGIGGCVECALEERRCR